MAETPTQGVPEPRGHRILIVDDDERVTDALERILEADGYSHITTTNDSRRVLPLFREVQPDVVLLDVHMPHLDGLYVMKLLRSQIPDGEYLPILVITGDDQRELKRQALRNGGNDYLTKPFDREEVELRVRNLLKTRDLHLSLEGQVRQKVGDLKQAEIEIARRLAAAAELRDYGGEEHTQRVGRISALIASGMGLPDDDVEAIRHAAPLHDLGKIAIPDEILLKPEALTLDELEIVKQHTTIGARALTGSRSPILQVAEEVALYHHENWDGSGYTPGLAGTAIPLVGRIVAAADCYDALVSDRPYKKAWPADEAIDFVLEESGSKFDPSVVEVLVAVHESGELAATQIPEERTPTLFPFPLPAL